MDPDYYKRQKLYIMLPLRIINLSEELELSTLAGELFSEELKDIEQEVNEMAKMIIDPEIYRRGFEEGLEKGLEKGIEKGVGKGIAETIIRQLCKKLGELPSEYKERILGQARPTLELIAENIFDIESLSELDRFLNQ
ncbi:MAG: DUF4351 domain-containing protein [Eubacteriales bacterium]|jgi:flagellar biosynthesis/type III secretory pathway protein FliH